MKPVVSAFQAWSWYAANSIPWLLPEHDAANLESSSTVVSVFAIIILSILASLYRSGHEEFMGTIEDPEDGKAVAGTIFTAVFVYIVRVSSAQDHQHPRTNSTGTHEPLKATITNFLSRHSLSFVDSRDFYTPAKAEEARSPYRFNSLSDRARSGTRRSGHMLSI